MGQSIWDLVKNIGMLVAIILAMTQIWDWIGSPSESLDMELSFGEYPILPMPNSEFDRINDLLDIDKIPREINLQEILGDSPSTEKVWFAERIVQEFSHKYRAHIRESQKKISPLIKGYWLVSVRNNGSVSLSNVVLTLPNTVYVSLKREGGDPVFGESTDVIEIGNLRPSEKADVIAWSQYGMSALSYFARDARITHDRGVGHKSTLVPVGWIGQMAERFWPLVRWLLFSMLAWIGFVIIVQSFQRWLSSTKSAREKTDEAEEETS